MDWVVVLVATFGGLLLMMATGMPIAFCFALINIVGAFVFFNGGNGVVQVVLGMYASLVTFVILPLPLFVLMGELVFRSGISDRVLDVLDKWIGKLPGRLAVLSVAAGTLFAALTGSSVANVALLGTTLVPDMKARGYKPAMTLGPIMGAGGLAIMIPPTSMGVLLGAIGQISVAKILIAIVIPGLIMAIFYAGYIIIRCAVDPSLAPTYDVKPSTLSEKLLGLLIYVAPLGIIFFLVVGVIIIGVATPSEAAATGAAGVFFLAIAYRRMNWPIARESLMGTAKITGMMFLIVSGASAFSQIMAFSGAATGLANLALDLPVSPIGVIVIMMVIVLILGCLIDGISIMMITLPIFMPIVIALHFDTTWFAVIYLLAIETGLITPPFGMNLFVMKGVAPEGTTMEDVFKASGAFVALNIVVLALLLAFPIFSLWLTEVVK